MATLIGYSHAHNFTSDTYAVEFWFSDGKVVTDKILRTAQRSILANHLQQLADRLRELDAEKAFPEEDG